MRIRVAGIDPAFANMGMARMTLDLETLGLELEEVRLVQTEKLAGKLKTVRQNSDDLRRAIELQAGFQSGIEGCSVCFAEIPSGSQHSRSALGFGIAIGVLSASPIPIIEVMPLETKTASVGKKTAAKREIITWASDLYPDASGWLRERGKADGRLIDDNEHLADAVAIVHAGIRTPEFKRLIAVWKATPLPSGV